MGRVRPVAVHMSSSVLKVPSSHSLREQYRLKVFENGLLRKTFGPMREKITRDWRKLHNEKLLYMYSSPDIVGVIE
jgi:hypothetical protein